MKYSSSQISIITDSLIDDIKEWQERPLDDQYAVLWIDAIHYKIRQDNKVISKARMLVLGINMEGKQDILSMRIVENESVAAWSTILDDLDIIQSSFIFFNQQCYKSKTFSRNNRKMEQTYRCRSISS